MIRLERYSEAYSATGGLAAEGVINQLGRPDIDPLEVLVREAVQNCWDAKRPAERGIRVEIGRHRLEERTVELMRTNLLVDPPPGLPLAAEIRPGMETLYFADFGTGGLGGPTRADQGAPGQVRDFVDFVRNIGQPPDKELGGGSFGYGKAAFYMASRARTILVDTLCEGPDGCLERRFIGCALGENYSSAGRPFTGRHWWGRIDDGVPEPLLDADAEVAARMLSLPPREERAGLGTTVVIVAPGVAPDAPEGVDATTDFLAEALLWNFWPRMISTPGGTQSTMTFRLVDDGRAVRIPDPRVHERLRGFVEAMDRLRAEPEDTDELVIDRSIDCLRPIRKLGRLVVQKGPVAPLPLPDRAVPQGARQTADSVHHVALMRNAELVVKYLRGPDPVIGRFGYAGVFRCALDVDEAFRRAEPPTHDDWVYRSVPAGHDRTFVKVAIERVSRVCREAAGYDGVVRSAGDGGDIPLGEFADALATLMPSLDGPGARRAPTTQAPGRRRRRHAPGRTTIAEEHADIWVDGGAVPLKPGAGSDHDDISGGQPSTPTLEVGTARAPRPPQTRAGGDPRPAITPAGEAVVRYPFELRGHGNRLRLTATIEVMTNDGAQVEAEAPRGYESPTVSAWVDPSGTEHRSAELVLGPEGVDGPWVVEVPIREETMMRVDVVTEIA
jgi:hypothetical protein